MNMRQFFMLCTLALMLVATLGATAARDLERDLEQVPPGSPDRAWLKTSASDRLRASRLNITIVAKIQREETRREKTVRKAP